MKAYELDQWARDVNKVSLFKKFIADREDVKKLYQKLFENGVVSKEYYESKCEGLNLDHYLKEIDKIKKKYENVPDYVWEF